MYARTIVDTEFDHQLNSGHTQRALQLALRLCGGVQQVHCCD
jgi:hypothetical protein